MEKTRAIDAIPIANKFHNSFEGEKKQRYDSSIEKLKVKFQKKLDENMCPLRELDIIKEYKQRVYYVGYRLKNTAYVNKYQKIYKCIKKYGINASVEQIYNLEFSQCSTDVSE